MWPLWQQKKKNSPRQNVAIIGFAMMSISTNCFPMNETVVIEIMCDIPFVAIITTKAMLDVGKSVSNAKMLLICQVM